MCSETANYSPIMMRIIQQQTVNPKLSIYIPHITHHNATEEFIKYIFKTLNIADVNRVDFQDHINQVDKIAFVHMNQWYTNVVVEHLQSKIIDDNQEARIVYDDPNYWILRPNKQVNLNNYLEDLSKLQTIVVDSNKIMTEQIYSLEQKNTVLENTVKEMQWWINLHDANIKYLTTQNQSDQTNNTNNTLFTNNSCCGAVSDAWNPSGEPTSSIH